MKNLILRIFTFTIIIGVVALAFNNIFGNETITYLQKERITMLNGQSFFMWKIDWWGYVNNLQLATTNTSVLELKLPTREWNNDVANDLALLIDFVILLANILLYPIKLGAYLLQNIMAILGVNTDATNNNNGLAWLVIFVRDILGRISIPYV